MKTNLFLSATLSLSLCAASTAQTLPAYLPTDGLAGWWPFNGNANDESGNGNDGVVNGATLTTDRFGNQNKAYELVGYNNTILFGNNVLFDFSEQNDISISYWLKRTTGNIFSVYKYDNGAPANSDFALVSGSNQNINMIGDGTNSLPFPLTGNEWKQITAVFSSQVNESKVYVNGELVLSGTLNVNNGNGTAPLAVNYAYGIENYTTGLGKIDDMVLYNRALSTEEISALYTGEPVNPTTNCNPLPTNLQNGLLGYWPFCGNANDESGNGNDGTVNGAVLTTDRFGNQNQCYDFDGINDRIVIPNNLISSSPAGYSVSVWFKTDSLHLSQGNNPCIITDRGTSWGYKYAISRNIASQQVQGSVYYGGPGNGQVSSGSISNDDLNWHHAVSCYNDSLGTISLYIDGELTQSTPNITQWPNNLSSTTIGAFNSPSSFGFVGHWDGLIDDIAIFNRALSAAEVQQLYSLNTCTYIVYDTITTTITETIFDTTTVTEILFDTITVNETIFTTVYDTVTVENLVTIYDTVSVSVSTTDTLIINTLITAVEPAQENTFLVYPNPASTQITINNGNAAILSGYTMRITNSLGQDVYNQNITQPELTLDLSSWSGNGLYVLYILDPQQNIVAVKQIVLQ